MQTPSATAQIITQAADSLRTGWYPNQPQLRHEAIRGERFGRTFYRQIEGQGYAQPLVVGDVVLVATNDDWIYGLDAQTGDVMWSRSVGPPIDARRQVNGWCPNPSPHVGILGTPVVDAAAGVAYFVAKSYVTGDDHHARFLMHAVGVETGAEQPGFPVPIAGTAENLPEVTFDADYQIQRPGLALVDGVVYAAFGGICDSPPYQGWIFGVSTNGTIEQTWAVSARGGSIWQSGGAIVSDGPGQLIATTGNGSLLDGTSVPGPGPGHVPPASLAQSVVRISKSAGGRLQATDFFSPWNNAVLDNRDLDLASSAPMALPSPAFGTSSVPRLLVQDGKEGYLYLLDRDNLGGMGQGENGTDAVVQRLGPYPGVWDAMAAWPGDGGYIYFTAVGSEGSGSGPLMAFSYSVDEQDRPRLALAGVSLELFGYGSGSPVVTSDGTTSGSATVWATWCPTPDCTGAELRAYESVPSDGKVRMLWRSPIGVANKFTPPGIGEGRVYVATRDGHLVGYGPTPPLRVEDVSFGDKIVGERHTTPVTITATEDVSITRVATDDPEFSVDLTAHPLPLVLRAGDSVTLPATYAPTSRGPTSAELTIETAVGRQAAIVSGTGLAVQLDASTPDVDFGSVRPDAQIAAGLTFVNSGDVPLTVTSLDLPDGAFTTSGFPSAGGAVIPPGGIVGGTVRFRASAPGSYADMLRLHTDGASAEVRLSATVPPPAADVENVSFGAAVVGQRRTRTVRVTARRPLVVDAVSPSGSGFSAGSPSQAMPATLAAGDVLTVPVAFAPTQRGPASGTFHVSTSAGEFESTLTGTGIVADLRASASSLDLRAVAGRGVARGQVELVASGESRLTIESIGTPAAPFGVDGLPPAGAQLAPGDRVTVGVSFRPLVTGAVSDVLEVVTEAGAVRVSLVGTGTLEAPFLAADVRPRLSGLGLHPRLIRRGRASARTRLTFRLANAGTVSVALVRETRLAHCRSRQARRCMRLRTLQRPRRYRAHAGLNRLWIDLPTLAPGSYRLEVTPREGRLSGRARTISFQVR